MPQRNLLQPLMFHTIFSSAPFEGMWWSAGLVIKFAWVQVRCWLLVNPTRTLGYFCHTQQTACSRLCQGPGVLEGHYLLYFSSLGLLHVCFSLWGPSEMELAPARWSPMSSPAFA